MKSAGSSEPSAYLYETTRRYNQQAFNLQERGSEKFKYHVEKYVFPPGTEPDTQIKEQLFLGILLPYISAVCIEISIQ